MPGTTKWKVTYEINGDPSPVPVTVFFGEDGHPSTMEHVNSFVEQAAEDADTIKNFQVTPLD